MLSCPQVWRELFSPLHALNFGIGGDTTCNVLWRLQNGELENIRPKVRQACQDLQQINNLLLNKFSYLLYAPFYISGANLAHCAHYLQKMCIHCCTFCRNMHVAVLFLLILDNHSRSRWPGGLWLSEESLSRTAPVSPAAILLSFIVRLENTVAATVCYITLAVLFWLCWWYRPWGHLALLTHYPDIQPWEHFLPKQPTGCCLVFPLEDALTTVLEISVFSENVSVVLSRWWCCG